MSDCIGMTQLRSFYVKLNCYPITNRMHKRNFVILFVVKQFVSMHAIFSLIFCSKYDYIVLMQYGQTEITVIYSIVSQGLYI